MNYIVLIIVVIVAFVVGRMSAKSGTGATSFAKATESERKEIQQESREALTKRTEDRKFGFYSS